MSNLMELVQAQLIQAGYAVGRSDGANGPTLLFENDSILGFVLGFTDAGALIEGWQSASQRVLKDAQFSLRRAEAKSWNVYFVFLAEAAGDYGQSITLYTIEENLVGTRKIARAGVMNPDDARAALLPLLAIQNAPVLGAVDMLAEIRLRTSELPAELVEAFLASANETVLLQLLEATQ